jgi:ankyrin repeat protein
VPPHTQGSLSLSLSQVGQVRECKALTGGTAFHVAAEYHHADILPLLADRGANVNYALPEGVGGAGETPLRVAVGSRSDRDPDSDGARQLEAVRALHRLGAG